MSVIPDDDLSTLRFSRDTPSPVRSMTDMDFTIGVMFKLKCDNVLTTNVNYRYEFGLSMAYRSWDGARFLGIKVNAGDFNNSGLFNITTTSPSNVDYGQYGPQGRSVMKVGLDRTAHLNKWLLMAFSHNKITLERNIYLIDCETATVLQTEQVTASYNSPAASADYDYQHHDLRAPEGNEEVMMGEEFLVNEILTQQDLIDISQQGFVASSYPSTILVDNNFMLPLDTTSAHPRSKVRDSGNNDRYETFHSGSVLVTSTDNPVSVLRVESATPSNTSVDIQAFSILTETAKVVVYPINSSPSASDVFNGIGATATTPITFDGSTSSTVTVTGLSSGTTYDVYAVQESGTGGYILTEKSVIETDTGFTIALTDVEGTALNNVADIEYAIFLGTAANALSTEIDSGLVTMVGDSITLSVTGVSSGSNVLVMLSKAGVEYGTYPATLS